MPAPLLAVDAPSMLYRAFFALPKTIGMEFDVLAGETPIAEALAALG